MKKIWLIVLALCLILPGAAGAAQNYIGKVKGTRGLVSIVRNGKTIPAYPMMKIQLKDVIMTGSNGALGILLKDNTLLSMGPMSKLSMDKFVFSPDKNKFGMQVTMQQGTFVYLSGLLGKLAPLSVDIKTPVGEISMLKKTNFMARFPRGNVKNNVLYQENSITQ